MTKPQSGGQNKKRKEEIENREGLLETIVAISSLFFFAEAGFYYFLLDQHMIVKRVALLIQCI